MLPEYRIVIADTSCFILLDKINALDVLFLLFNKVVTTVEIATEFGKPLPEWVIINQVSDKQYHSILELEVDKGEASAIALALESKPSLLILDDLKARKLADKLMLEYTGTLGLFLKAKESGKILQLKPFLEKIQMTNFRFSQKIFDEILTIAGEG